MAAIEVDRPTADSEQLCGLATLTLLSTLLPRSSGCQLSTVNCQLSTVNCQLSTVNCQLST
ncbi:hypothetical protein [Microcoleus sp. AR_TQ3_B6]|uniref:hypothetical protein n=1 Tax=Microcoleus sp. AR_TQ3_B6 TaxID=3055284 RepID=UPI002FCEB179